MKSGVAVLLASEDDAYYLEPVERSIGQRIPYRVAEEADLGDESEAAPRKERGKDRDQRRRKRW